jgi:hypothetical protein
MVVLLEWNELLSRKNIITTHYEDLYRRKSHFQHILHQKLCWIILFLKSSMRGQLKYRVLQPQWELLLCHEKLAQFSGQN